MGIIENVSIEYRTSKNPKWEFAKKQTGFGTHCESLRNLLHLYFNFSMLMFVVMGPVTRVHDAENHTVVFSYDTLPRWAFCTLPPLDLLGPLCNINNTELTKIRLR